MHQHTPSYGGLFKGGNPFGSGKNHTFGRRPSTSGGLVASTTGKETGAFSFSRKSSLSTSTKPFRGRVNSTAISTASSLEKRRPSTQHSYESPINSYGDVVKSGNLHLEVGDEIRAKEDFGVSGHARTASYTSSTAFADMLVRPGTSYSSLGAVGGGPSLPPQPSSPTLENITFQHIQETSSKRISTLDYLRKAHEGRVYWFNTLLFNKPDIHRMPYFESRKLARRATNYLLLGLSLPTVLDLNSSNPTEFLKTLNALLVEFESFQSIHPPDGSSSLSRARFPQMFKRATTGGGKGRRSSSAADIGLPMGNDSADTKAINGASTGGGANSATAFTMGETDLLPGEEYVHLLTPSLPFDPDFYETFATLCDVLIDCYTKLMSLVSGPRECSPYIAEMFTKADARVRKIIVQGVVKEFEDSSRAGVKGEIAGVGRVVLGGLM